MNDELLFFNGIDGDSGDYLTEPMSPQSLAALARGERPDPRHLDELRWKQRQPEESHYGWAEGIDPKNLSETGWGVIFPFDEDPAVREALRELLDHRRNQATKKNEQYYKEYVGPGAYRPGESKRDFLARCGVGFGPAHPEKVPYYLLIVASPEKISYRFQYQLDVQYAVGRIYFDTPEEYAHYARRVVDAETRAETKALRVAFVGVANPDDKATAMSTDLLVQPLARAMSADYPNWKVETYLGDRATKERLLQVMGGNDTPTLLFTASHGMGFPNGDPRQLGSQGALLCQNWPGPKNWGRRPIPPDFYLGAGDIASDADLQSLITLNFACYGIGTPHLDEFSQDGAGQPKPIAPYSFVARLPQRLLAHPKGGALAVLGHIERAWSYSFSWPGAGQQIGALNSTMKRLMDGYPVGAAMEYLNQRYAELATELNAELEDIKYGKTADDMRLAGTWAANNDAKLFALCGDPAVHVNTRPAP